MSGLMQHISKDFEKRMTVRRGMLAHLGLAFTDEDAARLRPDIRETLIACSCCANPDTCRGWVRQKRPGTPMFCRARDAFLRLEAATGTVEKARRSA